MMKPTRKNRKRALFLDRDGVINVDHGYVATPERCDFIDGIFDLCRHAASEGYIIIIITNQAGIGRGLYSEAEFHGFMSWMGDRFFRERAPISKVYFCPYHPQHGIGDYKRESNCRKPNPGMILDAANEFPVDLPASVLIGDKMKDVEAGLAAGIGTLLLFDPDASSTDDYTAIKTLNAATPLLRSITTY